MDLCTLNVNYTYYITSLSLLTYFDGVDSKNNDLLVGQVMSYLNQGLFISL